ncbi:AbrB/MazE/SpoVT family DNA-binding domain-containing protein [Pseudonocardia sp. NPDC049635]|uniref:AbrB/MazE/SpoVT family DNA-binding domain-containing protein n=1 Tax=Pseudonocardia sp. NPDC049635 TaxID=3155506 RepID=UPI0033CC1C63
MTEQVPAGRSAEVVVNQDGRVLIPAQIRRDLQMDPGATLILSVEDGRVVLETREQLIDRMRREIAESWTGDPEGSPVDELIAERRTEAAAENAR